jgi:tRNA(fMet)-specific endonuclease VapC
VLDTDHVSILQQRAGLAYIQLSSRLAAVNRDEIAVTMISFQEQMKGWLALLNRARSSAQVILAYGELERMARSFCKMNILSYTDASEDKFVELRKQRIRVGTSDLRIAPRRLSPGRRSSLGICAIFARCPDYPLRTGQSERRVLRRAPGDDPKWV